MKGRKVTPSRRNLLGVFAIALALAAFSYGDPATPVERTSIFEFTASDVAVSGDTYIDSYIVLQNDRLATIDFTVACADAGSGTVDEFVVLLKRHPSDPWRAYLSGSDWATATANNPYTENLASIAAGSAASARIYVGAACAVAFQVSAGTEAVDTVTVRGSIGYE